MIEYKVLVSKAVTKWYHNGLLHREDGPAVIYNSGEWEYYRHGILHREDGPASNINGNHWYLDGDHYSEEAWEFRIAALFAPREMTVTEIEDELGYKIKVIA